MPDVSTPKSPLPTAPQLFFLFARIGLSSFGGGLSGWLMREVVTKHNWMSQQDFLSGLALSQALPGLNVVNLSVWIGYKLRGRNGAFAASCGMVIPALILAVALAMAYENFAHNKTVSLVMAGIAAAAIGLSLEMGIRATRYASNGLIPIAIIAGMLISITVLEWSLITVTAVAAPISIMVAWLRLRGK
ncbi:chromate transporter [Paenalcaligenes niemegkensis]|uniref:chromate transporter n=1 Tax=Paenalcaligenes niemegkensis TaxID=2895469 RepID=UPI001EE8D667|nr:chromate transporter [Paenalcaligenes niemegkensis]MCQ9618167.1 chromate transporter [Paenalcaligenes niemegkensis]